VSALPHISGTNNSSRQVSVDAWNNLIDKVNGIGLAELFVNASALDPSPDTVFIQTTGYSALDVGSALYVYDAAVNAAYVTAHPRSSFLVADGRGFRISLEQDITPQMFGDAGGGVTDDTAVITAALAASRNVHIPAGIYIVSSISVPANTIITTDGHNTIIKQKSGTAANTRIIKIVGSNVSIGDISVEGQLNQSGDTTGEQNHGIFIALEASSTASLSNITIGNVRGTNIRGDVVYIGTDPTAYTAGYRLSQVRVGQVIGSNVFRANVSITGGSDISIESVSGTQVGKTAFNAEQDAGSGPITGLWIGYIKGRNCQFAGPTAAEYIEAVVGEIDLDPSYTTTSSPDYGGTDFRNGLTYRNCKSLRVERLYANGHYGQAIFPVTGALARQEISIGNAEIPTGCATEATNACYIFGDATTFLTIGVLVAATNAAVSNQAVFNVNTNTVVHNAQIKLAPATNYMRGSTDCLTLNINVTRASGNGGVVDLSGTRNRYLGGTQLCDYFFDFSTRCTAMGVEATAASSYDNSGTTNVFFSSRIGGTFVYFNDQANSIAINIGGAASLASVAVGGNQVVGARGAALPADATDLATALTLLNAVKARLKATGGHGLVAD
jgi:hypothetical protein